MPEVVHILRRPSRLGDNCTRPYDDTVKQIKRSAIAVLHAWRGKDVVRDDSDDEKFARPIWLEYSLTRLAQA